MYVVAGQGVFEKVLRAPLGRPGGRAGAPEWTRACRTRNPPQPSVYCAHVRGRVVWRQGNDPDGDGDRHLVLVVDRRLRLVKLPREFRVPGLPRLGTTIDASGYLMLGSSGRDEVYASRLTMGGRTYALSGPGR